jgi:hypothetical protein
MRPDRIAILGALTFSLLASVFTTQANAAAVRPNAGFTANVFLGNDDGTYPANGSNAGTPSGTPVAQPFGFSINFFGSNFSSGYINNNGNMTLTGPLDIFTPFGITGGTTAMLAPFFADVDTRADSGLVTFGTDTVGGNAAFAINWIDVNYFDSTLDHPEDTRNSFQLVLIDRSSLGAGDFDFEFNFDHVGWETGQASGGDINGLGGASAHVGWTNGAGTFLELPGSGDNGAFLDGGPDALIGNQRDSDLSAGGFTEGRYFFQVRNGEVQPPGDGDDGGGDGVPEPATLTLLGLGLAGAGVIKRRRSS